MMGELDALTPLLVYIQANLEEGLSLDVLSARAGLSSSHFQRLFKVAVGESPKAYVLRLRLERAAFRLMVQDAGVLDIALDCGFGAHETFVRAFRRRYAKTPSDYRDWVRAVASTLGEGASALSPPACEIGPTKVVRLKPLHVAFVRHVGPYEAVPESLFDRLDAWAARRALPAERLWLGIGHDAPLNTAADQLRFDAALSVPAPFEPEEGIGHQVLAGGDFALTTHAGPYETLGQAYATLFPRTLAFSRYRLIGLPVVEIYHTARVNVRHKLNHTDICLPLQGTE